MFQEKVLYHRKNEIHDKYGGQQRGGISTPKGHPFIFLFSGGGEGYGYSDGWTREGVYRFYGMGQVGDMKFISGNLAVRDHVRDGKELLLFQIVKKGQVRYEGSFTCCTFEIVEAPDRNQHRRQAIVFHLVPHSAVQADDHLADVADGDFDSLRERAFAAGSDARPASLSSAIRTVRHRSALVAKYVLKRSNGSCESCGQEAPFRRDDGSPYLEPHHTQRLADGGPDHPRWVAAVCPNCHREIHHGIDGVTKNETLKAYLRETEV